MKSIEEKPLHSLWNMVSTYCKPQNNTVKQFVSIRRIIIRPNLINSHTLRYSVFATFLSVSLHCTRFQVEMDYRCFICAIRILQSLRNL